MNINPVGYMYTIIWSNHKLVIPSNPKQLMSNRGIPIVDLYRIPCPHCFNAQTSKCLVCDSRRYFNMRMTKVNEFTL